MRRRATILAIVVIALLLVLVPEAMAAAGGGSAGFGGGGGGGGGGHGKGFAIYLIFRTLFDVLIFGNAIVRIIVIGVIVAAVLFYFVAPRVRAYWAAQEQSGRAARRTVAKRERRVELAAAEAAEDDDAFSPDQVKVAAAGLFVAIQTAWDAADRTRLGALVGKDLLAEWELRLDDFDRRGWRNRVQPLAEPKVEYVGLRRSGEGSERVVVRIEARLRDYVEDQSGNHIKRAGRLGETTRVREFWTLGRRDERWILLSIEQGAEGAHALKEEIVANPWSDDQAMRDEALVEGAVADAVPEGTKVAEVADLQFEGDARAAALDLSLADGRFAPDVLEIAARRAVQAWAEAVDSDDRALLALAHPDAARAMLHPGDPSERTRLVVRGLRVKQIRIAALDAAAEPPTMTIDVELNGRRYVEERSTAAVVSGSQSRATNFTERWVLALDGSEREPWRIAAAGEPVAQP